MYKDYVKYFQPMYSFPFVDRVSGKLLDVHGIDTTVTMGDSYYQMKTGQRLISEAIPANIESKFTMGFWLYSKYLGRIDNSGVLTDSYSPIISLYNNDETIAVRELYLENEGECKIQVAIGDAIIETDIYESNKWMFVLFVYDEGQFSIKINGSPVLYTITSGGIPSEIEMALVNIDINNVSSNELGFVSSLNRIKDLFVLSDVISSIEISLALNYYMETALVKKSIESYEISFPILDSDPYSDFISSMDGNEIKSLAGDYNGTIYEIGHKKWDVRFDFSSMFEREFITNTNKNVSIVNNRLVSLNGGAKILL